MDQVSPVFLYLLEEKIRDLDREVVAQRASIENVEVASLALQDFVETLKKGDADVTIDPAMDQRAAWNKMETVDSSAGIGKGCNANCEKKGAAIPPHVGDLSVNSAVSSVPPHLRKGNVGANASYSVPPHKRGKTTMENNDASVPPHMHNGTKDESSINGSVNDPLVTDGNVDISAVDPQANEPTPPTSPKTAVHSVHGDLPIGALSLNSSGTLVFNERWLPNYIASLAPLPSSITIHIPSLSTMESFSPDLLHNHLGGIQWSPGLNFIPPTPSPCVIVPHRTYFTVDPHTDPFLPSQPGLHGAKLVPFFNSAAEDEHDVPDDIDSSQNFPLFVLLPDAAGRKRFFYFGHYSQSRWSDKLDHDRMIQCVPQHVRDFWAEELSASGRPEWLTKQLLRHFFPKPEYEGRLFGIPIDQGGSVASSDIDARESKVYRDVRKYVDLLRSWEKDAHMKTSLVKKEFILQAFERADADDPPALRLWWEYLECVDWKPDFYQLLVGLQGRNKNYDRY